MNKITEALKMAEKTLRDIIRVYKFETGTPVTALAAIREALAEPVKQEPVAHKWPLMGYGNVAIGGCKQPDGTSGLIYLDMVETREIDADTTDLFPVRSEADPSKLLACIYFKDGSAIQQTIDVLREMQIEIGYAAPADTNSYQLPTDLVASHEREACAKVCMKQQYDLKTRQTFAAAIRARGEK